MQAADQGWSSGEQVGALGISELDLSGLQGGRKVQAWLYDGLNKGLLAGRIQSLMLMSGLLEDWYFSWGLLRTEGSLQDVLIELVKVPLHCSRTDAEIPNFQDYFRVSLRGNLEIAGTTVYSLSLVALLLCVASCACVAADLPSVHSFYIVQTLHAHVPMMCALNGLPEALPHRSLVCLYQVPRGFTAACSTLNTSSRY